MEVTTAPQVSNSVTSAASSGVDFGLILVVVLVILIIVGSVAGMVAYFYPFFANLYKYREREKYSLGFVLLQITVPRGNEIKIDAAEQFINALYSIKIGAGGFMGMFKNMKPQPHISFEIVGTPESIRFYVACHKKYQDLIEKQINGAYPDAAVKEVPEYNIFTETGKVAYAAMKLRADNHFPIKTYKDLPTDPLSSLTSALAKMQPGEGTVIQILLAPADGGWKDIGKKFLKKERDPGTGDKPKAPPDGKQLEAVENKIQRNGFSFVVRIVTSSTSSEFWL
jgi:hypothetical protein